MLTVGLGLELVRTMDEFLGIDTSNYTTSAAIYVPGASQITQQKQLLPVKKGLLGLKQSDAVFGHVKQLPQVLGSLLADKAATLTAVGVSVSPRDAEGSYMPCFLVGKTVAEAIGLVNGIPVHPFSHQTGHVAAALYGCGLLELLAKNFIAFHVSGGTTEMLLVEPDEERIINITQIGGTLDLNAGQAVDRVGRMLGLPFPAGRALDRLARQSGNTYLDKAATRPTIRGLNCSLSGVENKCMKLLEHGLAKEDIARFCIDYIARALEAMTKLAVERYGSLPIVYAGGVMSNTLIRSHMEAVYGGMAHFASPEYSSDNAAGVALLAAVKEGACDRG